MSKRPASDLEQRLELQHNAAVQRRLAAFVDSLGAKHVDFYRLAGMSSQRWNNYLRRPNQGLNSYVLAVLCNRFGIDANWLLLGVGAPPWERRK